MYRWFSVRVECVFFTAWSTHQLPQYRGPSYFSLHFFGRRSRAINLNRCPLECSSVRNTKELGIIPHAVVQDAGSFNLVIFFVLALITPLSPLLNCSQIAPEKESLFEIFSVTRLRVFLFITKLIKTTVCFIFVRLTSLGKIYRHWIRDVLWRD